MTPRPPLAEQQLRTITTVTDAQTGETTRQVTSSETMLVDPDNGSTQYTITRDLLLSADARITPIESTFTCRSCNTRHLSDAVRKTCTTCGVSLCSACAKRPPFCPPCRRNDRLKRFFRWLSSL